MMNEAKVQLRLPPHVREWLADAAKRADRSMNGQMIAILKEKMAEAPTIAQGASK
jgi:hypothetical protein